ncbi:MAG: penicillin-binding protein 2 [Polyangiales bacterium]
MTMLSVRREVGEFRKRYKWMALFVALSMTGIVVRLVDLQLFEHARWAAEAERNITRRMRLPATRGLIRDIKGKTVAGNRPAYDVYVTPQLLSRGDVDLLAKLMGFSDEQKADLLARLGDIPERRRTHVVELYRDISRAQLAALETHRREIPGLQIVAVPVRTYPFGNLAAHAIGYLNQINAEDLKRFPERSYQSGDSIGRAGIEAAWESYLRGHDGELSTVIDARNRDVEEEASDSSRSRERRREPSPGRNLRLTLDMDLMRVIERVFRGHPSGAAVVVDVRTGRVRALFSKPAYDLNEMSGRLTDDRAAELNSSPFRPLIDKTVYETYFAGSTFKPVSALAALQEGSVTPSTHFDCPGYYDLGRRRFRCSHAHGEVDMRQAIIQSCNVYFYHLAELVGLDRISQLSHDFGLGALTGIGINSEAQGFVPTREWYMKQHGDQYHIGFTLNAAIGQGDTRLTLIQMAMAYAAIANGGTLYVPQLVQAVEAPDGSTIEELPPRVRRRVEVDAAHLAYVIDGMFGVVNDPNGTAYDARVEGGIPVAGKTGTAQVSLGRRPGGVDVANAWYYRRAHAWFAGFAPADDPELAIVVLVEHGGQGGKYAAPIATRVLQEALGGGPAMASRDGARTGAASGTGGKPGNKPTTKPTSKPGAQNIKAPVAGKKGHPTPPSSSYAARGKH